MPAMRLHASKGATDFLSAPTTLLLTPFICTTPVLLSSKLSRVRVHESRPLFPPKIYPSFLESSHAMRESGFLIRVLFDSSGQSPSHFMMKPSIVFGRTSGASRCFKNSISLLQERAFVARY
jgi:hypothetical protein